MATTKAMSGSRREPTSKAEHKVSSVEQFSRTYLPKQYRESQAGERDFGKDIAGELIRGLRERLAK
jgi:hypothetical protein